MHMGKYKRLAGDTLLFAIGNLGSKLILFLLVPLYTNYLTKAEYGTAELIYTASNLIMPVTSMVIFDAVLRFMLDKNVDRKSVILNAGIVFIGGSLVALLLAPLVGLYPSLSEWKWFVSAYIITYMANQITMTYIKAKEKTKLYVVLGLSQTLLLALLNIFLLVFCRLKVYGYVLANIFAQTTIIIAGLVIGGILKDLKTARFDKKLFFEMLAFSSPLIINNISWWVVQSSDKLMVEIFLDSAALGIYTAASKIPALINVVSSIFSQSWGISSSFAVFFFCACLLVIIKPFMGVYVGADFYEAWKYVPWLLIAASFSAISSYFGAIYGALKKSVNVMLSTLLSASINIIFNFLLIPRFGIMGATAATAVAYIFIGLYRMFDTRRFFKFDINFRKEFASYLVVCISAFFVTADQFGYAVAGAAVLIVWLLNLKEMKKLLSAVLKFVRLR